MQLTEIASGLRFPEGPIAFPDESFVLVEQERQTLSRVTRSGKIEVIAWLDGCPNGAAVGPDGKIYVCNNGGARWIEVNGRIVPGGHSADYSGGRIERVDPTSAEVEVLYRSCNGQPLFAPNDLVFDKSGGFYFTDTGRVLPRRRESAGIYYARHDGSAIQEVVYPIDLGNGIGLSADESTLFVSETLTGRLWAFELAKPGEIVRSAQTGLLDFFPGRLVAGLPGLQLFDGLALDEEGNVNVATLMNGGITSISQDGQRIQHRATQDFLTTNICFGGAAMSEAYITLGSMGKLVKADWHCPGQKLNFLNT